jgi:5'-nucleotidase
MSKRLSILLTNDDGYASTGIKSLYDALNKHNDVLVAAPKYEQSGVGHSFTFNRPIYSDRIPENMGMSGFMIEGTPSDCVKFAVSHLMDRKPDIVVSGMNRGENSGISGFYSGTVAGAREGAFWRIPAFAFSLDSNENLFDGYSGIALDIILSILDNKEMRRGGSCLYYNINFPGCPADQCRGIKITRQSMAFFDDRYRRVEIENHPDGFLVYGEKIDLENSDEFDSRALINGYATITPLDFDCTADWALPKLDSLKKI